MIVTRVSVIPPASVYRRTAKANERYMEERLWQRALSRLDGPRPEPARSPEKIEKKERRSFRKVLGAIRNGLGRYVDIYA